MKNNEQLLDDLGTLVGAVWVCDGVEVRFYTPDNINVYAASPTPWNVGLGNTARAAMVDWWNEFCAQVNLVAELEPPYAPAVERDIEAMAKIIVRDRHDADFKNSLDLGANRIQVIMDERRRNGNEQD